MKLGNVRLSMGCFLLSRKKQPKKMKMTARERERWSTGPGFICPRGWHTLVLPLVWLYKPTLVAHEFHFWPPLVQIRLVSLIVKRILTNIIRKIISKNRQTRNIHGIPQILKSKMKNTELAKSRMDSGARPWCCIPVLPVNSKETVRKLSNLPLGSVFLLLKVNC